MKLIYLNDIIVIFKITTKQNLLLSNNENKKNAFLQIDIVK